MVPKHRHAIVARNRLKRRLREIVRTELLPRLDTGGVSVDVLVRARAAARHFHPGQFYRLQNFERLSPHLRTNGHRAALVM